MSKKIDSALNDLMHALDKHAAVAADKDSSRNKVQRATARVRAAATNYAAVVHAKRGMENPFSDVLEPGLEDATLASLAAERDAIALHRTGSIPLQEAPEPEDS